MRRSAIVDGLLFATVFTITFAKVRWNLAGSDLQLSDVTASLFVLAFGVHRLRARDWEAPKVAGVVAAFFLAFLLVYLIGFFNLETTEARSLFVKGLVKFVIHFGFLLAAIAHLARRSEGFYWRTLAWFVGGLAVNAAYGLLSLAYAEAGGGELDAIVLKPITGEVRGIHLFGVASGSNIYRTNGLTLDPNHLAIMLVVPLLVLLPLYLRLERGHRLRTPLAIALAFLFLVQLATLSRSGLLGLAVGLAVLAFPYRHLVLSSRVLVPLGALAGLIGLVVAQRTGFFETIFRVRTSLDGPSTKLHLELYDLLPPVLNAHPLFGLGLNTFSSYYEFLTGKTNWGPHSYYLALLTETGLIGAALFIGYLGFVFRRLGTLRRLGRTLGRAGDAAAPRVRPLAWGLTAALAGTLAANVFYLTMQMYYFFVFAMLALVAPVVFGRARTGRPG